MPQPDRRNLPLAPSHIRVLQELATGGPTSNKVISESLGLSTRTVQKHMERILDRLGAEDRTQALVMALQRGLVVLPGEEERRRVMTGDNYLGEV